jgi:hypothetical protein
VRTSQAIIRTVFGAIGDAVGFTIMRTKTRDYLWKQATALGIIKLQTDNALLLTSILATLRKSHAQEIADLKASYEKQLAELRAAQSAHNEQTNGSGLSGHAA